MKIAIVLCAFVGASLASPVLESYGHAVNTGRSQVMRKDDGHGNYEFGYDEDHHSGGTSRREKGGKGWATGSYELRDKDGRKRIVKYVADAHGFRAAIDTNEPGTDGKEDPADVKLSSSASYQRYEEPRVYIAKAQPQIIAYAQPKAIVSYAQPKAIVSYGGLDGGYNGGYDGGYDGGYGNDGGWGKASGYQASWSGPSVEYGSYGKGY